MLQISGRSYVDIEALAPLRMAPRLKSESNYLDPACFLCEYADGSASGEPARKSRVFERLLEGRHRRSERDQGMARCAC